MSLNNITELLVSGDTWTGLAHYYVALPLYPLFNIVHYILTAVALRSERGGIKFAFKHPIASCVLTYIVASSGGILASTALAKPPLECVLNEWNVLSCIIVWYLVFFSPMDLCYLLTVFTPLKLVLQLVEELARAKKIYSGVTMATSVYPHSVLAIALVGMLKGSGKRWGITLYRLSHNPQSASQHELLQISYVTKVSFLFGLLYAYNYTIPFADAAHLVLVAGIILTSTRLFLFFNSNTADPFSLPQGLTWTILTIFSSISLHGRLVDEINEELPESSSKTTKDGTSGSQGNPSSNKQKSD